MGDNGSQQITQITTSVKSVKSDVKKGTTEDTEDTEKSVKSDVNKVENNKSTFYPKINGFLFGGIKNNRYLCKQKETTILIIKNRAATYKRH